MEPLVNSEQYPNLLQTVNWGNVISSFELMSCLPPEHLISNVNLVPFMNGKCVVIKLDNGKWEMPGGTLEPNEPYPSAIERELMEEAGARLVTPFAFFGAWKFISSAEQPYRPHLPHPLYYRVVGYGEVEIVSAPLIPEDGEKVVAVEAVTLGEAKQHFMDTGRPDLAELYAIADVYRRS